MIGRLAALLSYCAAAVTIAFQVLLGALGVGLTLILFVVLGNRGAGGASWPVSPWHSSGRRF